MQCRVGRGVGMAARVETALASVGFRPARRMCEHAIGMTIETRLATPADAEVVAQLNAVVHQLHADARPDVFAPADAVQLCEWLRARLTEATTRCFVAEQGGQALGYLLAFVHERPAGCFGPARTWIELDQIAVLATQRRHGVARGLVAALEAEARRLGIGNIELNVWSFNDDARAAFERLGFRARALRMERAIEPR